MDPEKTDAGSVLWADNPKSGAMWEPGRAGSLIATHAGKADAARQYLRYAMLQGWIHPAALGPREAKMLDAAGVATGKVLSVLTDHGIQDPDSFRAVSLALNAWNDSAQRRGPGRAPIWAALRGARAERREEWAIDLRTYRHDTSEQRHVFAVAYWLGADQPNPYYLTEPGWQCMARTTVLLAPLLAPLVRRMEASLAPVKA